MKLYMAPMEGITGYIYRRAHDRIFHQIDRYYTPFLTNRGLNYKERQDILPENNEGMNVVPQILTNCSDVFLELCRKLQDFGYTEANLNLGCPSGTVTAKGKGSGFLRYPEELDTFLQQIFESCPLKISVKTRIGYSSEEEWPHILEILNRYPFTELIVHPRLKGDFYRGNVRLEAFDYVEKEENTLHRSYLCYNGDINSTDDWKLLHSRYPRLDCFMLGRGLIANPGLPGELRGEAPMDRERLAAFLDELLAGYRAVMAEEKNILFRLLEMWSYLGQSIPGSERLLKKMRKIRSLAEYEFLVKELLRLYESHGIRESMQQKGAL